MVCTIGQEETLTNTQYYTNCLDAYISIQAVCWRTEFPAGKYCMVDNKLYHAVPTDNEQA